jgi:superfamily II DNA helicase RecQ
MQLISEVMLLKVRVTFLTATLPCRLESEYKRILKLPKECRTIRASTNRPEHQYIILDTSEDQLFNHTVGFIHEGSTLLSGSQRAIVFVRSKEVGNTIKHVFPKIPFINGDIKDERARSNMIADWEAGRSGGWIIGTTSLIQGVDYSDVRLVVFAASPFGMVDFVQGAGRAGRNGRRARIVVLHTGRPIYRSKEDVADLECRKEMASWLKNRSACRRDGISECMDGTQQTCRGLLGNAAFCDACQPKHGLQAVWDNARKLDLSKLAQELQLNLSPDAQKTASLAPANQLAVIPLRPQLAPPDVLRKSAREASLSLARLQAAIECVNLLQAFSPNCGICHAVSGGKTLTGQKHKKWSDYCKPDPKWNFGPFYYWNKPMDKGPAVRGFAQTEHRR